VSLDSSAERWWCLLVERDAGSLAFREASASASAPSVAEFLMGLRVSMVFDALVVAGEVSTSTLWVARSLARFLARPRVLSVSFDCDCNCDCGGSVAYFAPMARSLSMPDILVVGRAMIGVGKGLSRRGSLRGTKWGFVLRWC
jgi:hypothetical protein